MYHNPAHDPVCRLTPKELQEGFDAVYEDLYCELAKFGHLLELHVRPAFRIFTNTVMANTILNRYVTMLVTI